MHKAGCCLTQATWTLPNRMKIGKAFDARQGQAERGRRRPFWHGKTKMPKTAVVVFRPGERPKWDRGFSSF